jgi:hypothetical protein
MRERSEYMLLVMKESITFLRRSCRETGRHNTPEGEEEEEEEGEAEEEGERR